MKRISRTILATLIVPLCAWSQFEHGTLVVGYADENGAAVAADSRAIIGGRNVDDSVCKISTLGNQLIIGLSGIRGYIEKGGKWSWDGLAVAKTALNSLHPKPADNDLPATFSTAWARVLENQFTRELRIRPKEILADRSRDDGPTLASALVIGRGIAGKFLIYTIKINYAPVSPGRYSVHADLTPLISPGSVSLGHSEIANEIIGATTVRGRQWNSEISRQNLQSSARLRNAIPVIRIVELSAMYLPPKPPLSVNDVGGPVDAVKMTADGKIDWIQRKPNCPSN